MSNGVGPWREGFRPPRRLYIEEVALDDCCPRRSGHCKKNLRGDENAFRELFDSFFPRLYRFALVRLNGDQEEAREMVQQTFCKAFERLDSYRGEASLYGWMCQICRNTITDMGRRRQRSAASRAIWNCGVIA